jgi:hypothetical protein
MVAGLLIAAGCYAQGDPFIDFGSNSITRTNIITPSYGHPSPARRAGT